ncbi:MAG: alpha/beta hydrolase [Chloroflexota bacterium]
MTRPRPTSGVSRWPARCLARLLRWEDGWTHIAYGGSPCVTGVVDQFLLTGETPASDELRVRQGRQARAVRAGRLGGPCHVRRPAASRGPAASTAPASQAP